MCLFHGLWIIGRTGAHGSLGGWIQGHVPSSNTADQAEGEKYQYRAYIDIDIDSKGTWNPSRTRYEYAVQPMYPNIAPLTKDPNVGPPINGNFHVCTVCTPRTSYVRSLVPKAIPGMAVGIRIL